MSFKTLNMEIRYTNPTCDGWPPPPVARLLDGFFYHDGRWYNIWAENAHIKWESGFETWPTTPFAAGTVEGVVMGFQILGTSHEYQAAWCPGERLHEAINGFKARGGEVFSITKALKPA